MSTQPTERLYNLLPTIYRQRDLAQGQPLRALLALIEQDFVAIEDDISQLYENWFIETCDEWVVPYLGDLLGVSGLSSETSRIFSQRGHVANVLGYRRRKGVLRVLEQVAQDMSGWSIRAVEYFELLGVAQHTQSVRPDRGATIDIRKRTALSRIGTPFDTMAARVDVRRIASGRGRNNVGNVGLFIWRLHSMPIAQGVAHAIDSEMQQYTFHPLGFDQQLFNAPQPLPDDSRPDLIHLPIPLTNALVAEDVARFVGADRSIQVFVQTAHAQPTLLPAKQIVITDLSNWVVPNNLADGMLLLDVERGRLARGQKNIEQVLVSYCYGALTDIGGGPYNRRHTLADQSRASWHIELALDGSTIAFDQAIKQWNERPANPDQPAYGIIRVLGNGTYTSNELITINVPQDGTLIIEAADGTRPTLDFRAGLLLNGLGTGATLILNGLLIAGPATVSNLQLTIIHCTLIDGLHSGEHASDAHITISESISGPLRLNAEIDGLTISDSIIDAAPHQSDKHRYAIAADDAGGAGPRATLTRTTVLGMVSLYELAEASDCLFSEQVRVQRIETGMVRYSYLAADSQTPPGFRCQPDPATTASLPLMSTRYGDTGYARLSRECPRTISAGAESGSEMGAYHNLFQLQREVNLQGVIDEYLPYGLEAGLFFHS